MFVCRNSSSTQVQEHTNAHEHADVQTTHITNLCAHPQICTVTIPNTNPLQTHIPSGPPSVCHSFFCAGTQEQPRGRLWVLELLHFLYSLVWQFKKQLLTMDTHCSPE